MASRTHKRARRRAVGGAAVEAAPPAPSLLADLPSMDVLYVDECQRKAFEATRTRLVVEEGMAACELRLGCVVRLDRSFPAVMTEGGPLRAEFAAQLTKGGDSRVVVGDRVCVRVPVGHDMALIQDILPRRSDLARWRGGVRGERQTLAANVDVVLATQALGATPLSCDRLARSAVIARDCGCAVAVVLTKVDRTTELGLADAIARVHDVLGGSMPVVATCAGADVDKGQLAALADVARADGAGWGDDDVRALVGVGVTAVVLGESGAGKSTLLNALIGHDALATGAVRERDDAGRHTTVARRMVCLPGAGVVIDAPGLRSLPLVGHERGLALVFSEVVDAAHGCRYRDCTHTHEPGCMVRAELEAGHIAPQRLDVYLALAREMRASASTLAPDVVL